MSESRRRLDRPGPQDRPSLYTGNMTDEPELIVRRSLWPVVSLLAEPEAGGRLRFPAAGQAIRVSNRGTPSHGS
jgi:hypothetical protein